MNPEQIQEIIRLRSLNLSAKQIARNLKLRPDRLIPIEFGREGKPYYINGPYDDAAEIAATLDRSVGKGNYGFLVGIGNYL